MRPSVSVTAAGGAAGIGPRLIIVHEEEITSSSTWPRPDPSAFNLSANAQPLLGEFDGTAAGGGGGGGHRGANNANILGGSPGAPGQRIRMTVAWQDIPSTIAITVGAAGTGGAGATADDTNGSDGTAGGDLTVAGFFRAQGGAKGVGGLSTTTTSGAASTTNRASYNRDTGQVDLTNAAIPCTTTTAQAFAAATFMSPGFGGPGGSRNSAGTIRAPQPGSRAAGKLHGALDDSTATVGGTAGTVGTPNGGAGSAGVKFGEPGDGGGGGYPIDNTGASGNGGAGGDPGGGGGGGACKRTTTTGNAGSGGNGGGARLFFRVWGYDA